MFDQMLVLAVHWHKQRGAHGFKHVAQFFTLAVARGMDGVHAFVQHFCADAVHFVDQPGDGLGVAGDHARTHDHGVALAYFQLSVAAKHHARQGGERFALRACHHQHDLVVRQVGYAVVRVEK